MIPFALRLVRPYWRWLLIVAVAMVVDIAMGLASPWPLKIVLDSVFDSKPMPSAFAWLAGEHADRLARLNVAVTLTVAIAILQAASSYVNAYFTVSIGQWIAHDLRHSVYGHLQRLSMAYYDKQQVGPLISTITDDINAVQDFASTSMLDLLIDGLTIVGMLAVMFTLNWRFTLVALAVTPLVVSLRSGSGRCQGGDARRPPSAERDRLDRPGGLASIRVVKAFAQGRSSGSGWTPRASRASRRRCTRARALAARTGGTGWSRSGPRPCSGSARAGARGAMTAGALIVFLTISASCSGRSGCRGRAPTSRRRRWASSGSRRCSTRTSGCRVPRMRAC